MDARPTIGASVTKTDAPKDTTKAAGPTDQQRGPKPSERRASSPAALPLSPDVEGASGRARRSIAVQRSLGNGRIARMALDGSLRHPDSTSAGDPLKKIQTKLTVNEPGDVYEREADAVAEKITQNREQPAPVARITRT